MCGGGGTKFPAPAPPPKPTYTADDGSVFHDAGSYNAYQRQLEQKAFEQSLSSALAGARSSGEQAISQWGLDANQYMPLIENRIADIRTRIPDLATDPASYFPSNIGESVLTAEQDRLRRQYTQDARDTFQPGFADNMIGDDFDDAVVNSLFEERYNPARMALDRAKARGTLSAPGYGSALDMLQQQSETARSRLQGLGGDILGGYRTELGQIGNEARTGASSYQLGNDFSLDNFTQRRDQAVDRFGNQIGTDLRGTLGDQTLFDLEKIMSSAGTFQGPGNTAGNLLGSIAERKKNDEADRGIGGGGSF